MCGRLFPVSVGFCSSAQSFCTKDTSPPQSTTGRPLHLQTTRDSNSLSYPQSNERSLSNDRLKQWGLCLHRKPWQPWVGGGDGLWGGPTCQTPHGQKETRRGTEHFFPRFFKFQRQCDRQTHPGCSYMRGQAPAVTFAQEKLKAQILYSIIILFFLMFFTTVPPTRDDKVWNDRGRKTPWDATREKCVSFYFPKMTREICNPVLNDFSYIDHLLGINIWYCCFNSWDKAGLVNVSSNASAQLPGFASFFFSWKNEGFSSIFSSILVLWHI